VITREASREEKKPDKVMEYPVEDSGELDNLTQDEIAELLAQKLSSLDEEEQQ
jgi:hypothetical protein